MGMEYLKTANTAGTGDPVSASNPVPVAAAGSVLASDGALISPDSLAQILAYDASGNLITVTVTVGGKTYIQTLTWTSGKLTGVSQWVKQ